MSKLKRRGDTSKCPACGTQMDSDAYRCPKCRIYFCFKCRVRVQLGERQFECADQSCNCYGKLLCAACIVERWEDKTVTDTELVDDHKGDLTGWALAAGGVSGLGAVVFGAPLFAAAAVGFGVLAVASFAATNSGYIALTGKKPIEIKVERKGKKYIGLCCVECRHPVKEL